MRHWINEPPVWSENGDVLTLVTGPETDFWSRTFYGFIHGNGHLYAEKTIGDFSASVSFSFAAEALYDQAGLMLMVDGDNWLKAGIEYTDGLAHFSVVLTRDGQSDWSVTPLDWRASDATELRITRHDEALRVQYRKAGGAWQMARLGYLAMPETVRIGPMACSPTREGLEVRFENFRIAPPISRQLHD